MRRVQHDPADPATIRTQLHSLFDDYTTPQLWPAYVFATLTHESADPDDGSNDASGESGPFTVFFGADHSIIDGYSIVLVAHEITALYEEERTGRPADLFPVGSYIDFGASERADASNLDVDHEAVQIWRTTLRESGGEVPKFPLPIGRRTTRTSPQRRLSERWFDNDEATRFSERCRDADAGFFAGVLACFGQAASDLAGADHFRTVVPSHTRTGPMWAGSLGWFVGLRPIDLDLGGSPGFVTLANRAVHELRRTRASARIPFDRSVSARGTHPPTVPRVVHGRPVRTHGGPMAGIQCARVAEPQLHPRRLHLDQPDTRRNQRLRAIPRQHRGERERSPVPGTSTPSDGPAQHIRTVAPDLENLGIPATGQ